MNAAIGSVAVLLGAWAGECRQPAPAEFEIAARKAEVRLIQPPEGPPIVDVTCPRGIGGMTIRLKSGGWPQAVVVRLRLRGLESLRVSDGTTTVAASVSSHGDATVRAHQVEGESEKPIDTRSPLWIDIRPLDPDGKPAGKVPLAEGCFEVTLPRALLTGKTRRLTLDWIDFYRG